jgi:hypothetical protein
MINWLYSVLERFLKRKRDKKYTKNVYFRSADEYKEGLLPIEILQGPFKGTVFTVTEFKLLDDYGKCKIDHRILVKQPGKHDSYYGSKFHEVVGEIVMVVLGQVSTEYKNLDNEGLLDGTDEDGEHYIEESFEERTLSSKGSPVYKI